MTDEEAAIEIERIIEIMERHDLVLKNTTPPLIRPYQSRTNPQSEVESQTRAVAGSQSTKIKEEAPIELDYSLSELAALDGPLAPTGDIVNHGLPRALRWADTPLPTPVMASQADQSTNDIRNKLVRSEVERLESLLAESEARHKVKDEQLHHLRCELGSSRRTVEDIRGGQLQQLRSALGTARRTILDKKLEIDKQELEIKKLNGALNHKKELLTVYKQLTMTQNMAENALSRGEASRLSLKRSSSPQPVPDVKRTRLSPAYANHSDRQNSSALCHQALSIMPPSKPVFDPLKAPRGLSGEQPLDLVRGSGQSGFTLRGPDLYNPPYSNHFLKNKEIDRYTPNQSVSKGSRDRYVPEYEVPVRTTFTADHDLTQSKPIQALGTGSQSLGVGESSRISGERRPLLPGNAPEAFARAQRLGVPYDPAKQPGIPRKCDLCSLILTSGSKLDQHMRRHHPGRRWESAPQT